MAVVRVQLQVRPAQRHLYQLEKVIWQSGS
jgi:hypothetical protein